MFFQTKDLVVFIREVRTIRGDLLVTAEELGVGAKLFCVSSIDMAIHENDIASLVMGDTCTVHPVALNPLAVGIGLNTDFRRCGVEIVLVDVQKLYTGLGTDGVRRVVVIGETVALLFPVLAETGQSNDLLSPTYGATQGLEFAPFYGDIIIVVVLFVGIEAVVGLREGVVVVIVAHFPSGHVLFDVGGAGDGTALLRGFARGEQHGG